MKKIILFVPFKKNSIAFGGAERRLTYIFSHLNNEDYKVILAYLSYGEDQKVFEGLQRYINEDVEIKYLKSDYDCFKYFIKEQYGILCYTDCAFRSSAAILGSLLTRRKRLIIVESHNNAQFLRKHWIEKAALKFNMRISNHIDCLYPFCIPNLQKIFRNKEITITPCVLPRMDRYLVSEVKQNVIMFSGRLIKQKNPDLFVDAVLSIQKELRTHNFVCEICGEGPLRNDLEDKVKQHKCEDIIRVRGYVNMEEVLPQARVFCSLQSINNYPSQALLEATACGCYCIASDEGDTHLIIDAAFGTLVKLNVDEISKAILSTLDFSKETWEIIQKNARDYAANNYVVDRALAYYKNIFTNL